jgi:hypothetical protein
LSNAIDNEIMLRILTLNLMILLLIALQRVLNKADLSPLRRSWANVQSPE